MSSSISTLTLTVNVTPLTDGEHRVCYRLRDASQVVSTDPYDCSTIISCTVGFVCSTDLVIEVDNETCVDTYYFEGYVQPTCFNLASENGRTYFNEPFIPDTECKSFAISTTLATLTDATIADAGSGLTPGVIDTENIGGTATIDVETGSGEIISYTINDGGSNYQIGDTFNIGNDVGAVSVGAGGVLTVDGVDGGGAITSFSITPGDDYDLPIAVPNVVNGIDADITVGTNYGIVTSVAVNAPGGDVPVGTPNSYNYGNAIIDLELTSDTLSFRDCAGVIRNYGVIRLNETIRVCSTDVYIAADLAGLNFNSIEEGCCVGRTVSYTISNTNLIAADVVYMQKDGFYTAISVPAESSVLVCAVQESIFIENRESLDNTIVITSGEECV